MTPKTQDLKLYNFKPTTTDRSTNSMNYKIPALFFSLLVSSHGNDNFANSELIANNSTTSGSNASAVNEPGEPSYVGYKTHWFKYNAPARGIVRINVPYLEFNSNIHVFRGNSLSALNLVCYSLSDEDHEITFPAEAGMEFRICFAVSDSSPSAGGAFSFTTQQDAWPYGSTATLVTPDMPTSGLPANDDISKAKVITSTTSPVTVLGYFLSATQSGLGPEPTLTGYETLWYKWTTPSRGIAVITTPASPLLGYGHSISVFRGSSITALTAVYGQKVRDYNSVEVKFPVEAGMEYWICFGTLTNSEDGRAVFSIRTEPWPYGTGVVVKPKTPISSVPTNDEFEGATVIPSKLGKYTVLDYNFSANTLSSFLEPGIGYKSLWYRWTAPENTQVSLQTPSRNGVGYGHALVVYTGRSYDSLTELPNDIGYFLQTDPSGGGKCGFSARKGFTYTFSFTSGGEDSFGPVIINMAAGSAVNPSGPSVKFASPASNAKVPKRGFYVEGIAGSDPQGVKLVELKVNGKVVHRKSPDESSNIFSKRVRAGKVKLEMRLMDGSGMWGKPAIRYVTAR
jgi:hypothetical protein